MRIQQVRQLFDQHTTIITLSNENRRMSLSEAKDAVVPVVTATTGTTTTNSRYDEEDGDEDYFADVGFMFESQQPVRLEQFQWDLPSRTSASSDTTTSSSSSIQIALHVADDDPGAVQSGHYLWPAAQMLSEYIIYQYSHHDNENHHHRNPNITTVIELGAGCAMVSFVALQLWKESLQCLCITDHDPSTLVRARDNYETTVQQLLQQQLHPSKNKDTVAVHDTIECNNNEDDEEEEDQDEILNDMINTVTNIPILYESLQWGDIDAVMKLLHQTLPEHLPLDLLLPSSKSTKSKSSTATAAASAEHFHPTNSHSHNHEISTMPNNHHHHHSFDIILGSDLIYCQEVVRPLFITAVQLMHPNHHNTNTNCQSCFILAQSFVYDTITEQEIDDICQELQLQRTIVMDFHNNSSNNDRNNNSDRSDNPSTVTNGNGRIQEFRFITTTTNR